MDQARARAEELDARQVFHDRRSVELLARHDLHPGLLHVRDHRQVELVAELPAREQEFLRAALRRRRGHEHADAMRAGMARAGEIADQGQILVGRRARQRPHPGQELRGQRLGERKVVHEGTVHHREAQQRPDAHVVIGLQHGVDLLAVDRAAHGEIVDETRRAGSQGFQRAERRAEIHLARRQGDPDRRPDVVLPELQGQVLGTPAVKVLVRMQMAVDQPGDQQAPRQIDDVVGNGHAVGGLDGGDALALDDHVERTALEGQPGSLQYVRPAQHRAAH